jgi:bifunctional UDP-N-acetylglucosamine pyrophosphorylase / glucosamine-1-phosphate N-acetyltransferase
MNIQIRGLILAAGKGTRMHDSLPKVLQPILGKPMLQYVIDHMKEAGVGEVFPIIGYGADQIESSIVADGFVYQTEQLGTGHAVMQAKTLLAEKDGITLVMAGDQPLISSGAIQSLIAHHLQQQNKLTLLTTMLDNPYGYGRILRVGSSVVGMIEEWDATDTQRLIQEVNISTYCFDNRLLFELIDQLKNHNKKQEYYINDLVALFHQEGHPVQAIVLDRSGETIGINDKQALADATRNAQQTINERHMQQGVTIVDPTHTYIGPDVIIGQGTIIYPNSVIEGRTSIGERCVIESSTIRDSVIGSLVTIGPYAHVRGQSVVHDGVRLGNFVELKHTILHPQVKAAHLTYLGDSEIGAHTNIGCGTITVNYDGKQKHRTIIGEHAFIGSNVNLIAPIRIGNRAVIAAGSTITDDVGDDDLAIARSYQTTKKGYYKSK